MSDAERLREQAQRCLRLADSTTDRAAAAKLVAMGRELEAQALEIEREQAASAKKPQRSAQKDC
jgi:hypothetical protein